MPRNRDTMAGNKSLMVLTPEGRRQNVKVTPNTTILQVLEEVCRKQGLKPEEYDIKHHNHILDTTQVIRFSGLPNNALLEMRAAQKSREEKPVILGLQLESGDRVMGDFLPIDSLWDVIKKLAPEEADPNSNPVIIYMRNEISGANALEETTLRSLGITGGRAMLRFLHRTPEQLHHQANVSGPLPSRPVEKIIPWDQRIRLDAPPEHPAAGNSAANSDANLDTAEKHVMEVKEGKSSSELPEIKPVTRNDTVHQHRQPVDTRSSGSSFQDHSESLDMETESNQISLDYSSSEDSLLKFGPPPKKETFEEIILLGERNAVAFSLDMAHAVPYEDLPDDFFDLTLEDAKAVYRDLKKKRAEMEDSPLVTAAHRNLEDSKRVLNQIHNYRRVVIRIQFPDRTVLQGIFLPLETFSQVKDFVKGYLQCPETDFYLYTTPPKNILASETRLVEAGCVPSALVHFGTDNPECKVFLREEILSQFSSPSAATIAACRSRGIVPPQRPVSAPAQNPNHAALHQEGKSEDQPTTSTHRGSSSVRQPPYRQAGGPNSKVPKWFKPIK